MFSFILFFLIVAIAHIASAQIHYEDDPRHFAHHHASQMTAVSTTLFVKRQSLTLVLDPRTPCQALRKLRPSAERGSFQYLVYYTTPGIPRISLAFTTTLSTSISPPHTFENVVTYQTRPGGPYYPFKVLYANRRSGCFILVFPHQQLGRGCRLLQTSYTVRREIPDECLRVYRRNCPRDDMQIFQPYCYWQVQQVAI